jgi:hypothetical protein
MCCSKCASQATICHDALKGILCQAVLRGGVASSLEPLLRCLPGLVDGPRPAPCGDIGDRSESKLVLSPSWSKLVQQGDVVLVLRSTVTAVDVSVIHLPVLSPCPQPLQPYAQQQHDASSEEDNRWNPTATPFAPFSFESYGWFGGSAIKLLHTLAAEAVAPGRGNLTCAIFF